MVRHVKTELTATPVGVGLDSLEISVKQVVVLTRIKGVFLGYCHNKRSAGVAQEVNSRNLLRTCKKGHNLGIHPGFETQGKCYQKSKTGVSVAPQKGLMSSKNFKKVPGIK